MHLRSKIDRLQSRAREITSERDDNIEIPIGVWHADRETGEVIPDSGPTRRVRREQRGAFGILLTRPPCTDKQEFAAEIARCNAYQKQLEAERTDPAA